MHDQEGPMSLKLNSIVVMNIVWGVGLIEMVGGHQASGGCCCDGHYKSVGSLLYLLACTRDLTYINIYFPFNTARGATCPLVVIVHSDESWWVCGGRGYVCLFVHFGFLGVLQVWLLTVDSV